jgi:Fic family protein
VDIEALRSSPVGQLIPIRGQDARHGDYAYFAYLPSRLPDDVTLDSSVWAAITEASAALGRLEQACSQLPDPKLLIRPALWREALDTSALEGTVGALPDILEAQVAPAGQYLSPETVEIRAYERVALAAFDLIGLRELSIGWLSEIQASLFAESRNKPRDLGYVREHQVFIGPRDLPIHEARFVPPPGDDRLKAELQALLDWMKAPSTLPPILRAAMAHYQFETLHPFGDGNGRIGRLMIVLQLLADGSLLTHPAITVSPWFLRRREQYQNHLLQLSVAGDWGPWIKFFCRALCEQTNSLVTAADAIRAWLESARAKLHARRWTGTIHQLLDDLIEWPVITTPFAVTKYDVRFPTASRMIGHLVEIGVLTEMTGKTYGRVYGAQQIIEIVDRI